VAGFVLIGDLRRFEVGDHVVAPKRLPTGQSVEHHGVVVERDGRLAVAHKTRPFPIAVRVTGFDAFADGDPSQIRVVEDRTETRVDAEARARRMIGDGSYSLLTDNCEHFASWAVRGKRECRQIARDWPMLARPIFGTALGSLASGAVWLASWFGSRFS
jgi:hypothetical protein